jgi:hypothetical protein
MFYEKIENYGFELEESDGKLFLKQFWQVIPTWKSMSDRPAPRITEYICFDEIDGRFVCNCANTINEFNALIDSLGTEDLLRESLRREDPDLFPLFVLTRCRGGYRLKFVSLVEVASPIPVDVPAIRSLADLCDYWGAETPEDLNSRVYAETTCGAYISILLEYEDEDGWGFPALESQWFGDDDGGWGSIEREDTILSFKIGTIVEGSDVTYESDEFLIPCTVEEMKNWIEDMEHAATRSWKVANLNYYALRLAGESDHISYVLAPDGGIEDVEDWNNVLDDHQVIFDAFSAHCGIEGDPCERLFEFSGLTFKVEDFEQEEFPEI